jgi:RHS repeat-associated protein
LLETDLNGNLQNEYIFFGGKRIARRDASGSLNYYLSDHLGSSRVVAGSAGTILDDCDFTPFGQERCFTSSSGNTYKFTGKERDPIAEGGNDHFPARDYTSSMGRWSTPDPLPWLSWQRGNRDQRQQFLEFIADPQNMNLYTYVLNNPISKTDPTGLLGCKVGDKTIECRIVVVYDKKTSTGTLYVLGKLDKKDKNETVLLKTGVVVGGDGHVTPTGTFTAAYWEKDHVSTRYGFWADTPWSKSALGLNAFGPYQLHIKELEKGGIYIHGTLGPRWNPFEGSNVPLGSTSHGCVRMCNRDVFQLHSLMPDPVGNPIRISTGPADAPED